MPTPIATRLTLEEGEALGHSLTSYAPMPGGFAMPITSPPSPVTDFNTEDQAAFVTNLARVLADRGVIKLVASDADPAAIVTVKFLKTEHFPNMQDYVIDALVTAHAADKAYEKVYHVSTMDQVNLVVRMFQNAIDGRRRAAELLLAAVVPDLEQWFASSTPATTRNAGTIVVPQPFATCAPEIARFLRERFSRPSTFWKDGVTVDVIRPSPGVEEIELRWSNSDALPAFCTVDLYGTGEATRIMVRERDPLLSARTHVTEAIEEYARAASSTPGTQTNAAPGTPRT